MSTANNVELLIITITISVLFVAFLVWLIEAIIITDKLRKLVKKADMVADDVGSAAEALKHMSQASASRFPLISLIHFVAKAAKDKDKHKS